MTRILSFPIAVLSVSMMISAQPADADPLQRACMGNISPPPMITPDVEDGYQASRHDRMVTDTLNEKPPRQMSYLGTSGYITQWMEAIPNTPTCPLGSSVMLKRPQPDGDMRYNRDCCPPGLGFESSTSVNIVGTPTTPGRYTKTILLCGSCRGASSPEYTYPIQATIQWDIQGRKPQTLD